MATLPCEWFSSVGLTQEQINEEKKYLKGKLIEKLIKIQKDKISKSLEKYKQKIISINDKKKLIPDINNLTENELKAKILEKIIYCETPLKKDQKVTCLMHIDPNNEYYDGIVHKVGYDLETTKYYCFVLCSSCKLKNKITMFVIDTAYNVNKKSCDDCVNCENYKNKFITLKNDSITQVDSQKKNNAGFNYAITLKCGKCNTNFIQESNKIGSYIGNCTKCNNAEEFEKFKIISENFGDTLTDIEKIKGNDSKTTTLLTFTCKCGKKYIKPYNNGKKYKGNCEKCVAKRKAEKLSMDVNNEIENIKNMKFKLLNEDDFVKSFKKIQEIKQKSMDQINEEIENSEEPENKEETDIKKNKVRKEFENSFKKINVQLKCTENHEFTVRIFKFKHINNCCPECVKIKNGKHLNNLIKNGDETVKKERNISSKNNGVTKKSKTIINKDNKQTISDKCDSKGYVFIKEQTKRLYCWCLSKKHPIEFTEDDEFPNCEYCLPKKIGGNQPSEEKVEEFKKLLKEKNFEIISEVVKQKQNFVLKCLNCEFVYIKTKSTIYENGKIKDSFTCENCNKKPTKNAIVQYSEFKNLVEKYKYVLLDSVESYQNNTSKLQLKCPNGHIFKIAVTNFKYNQQRCRECADKRISESRKFTKEQVIKTAEVNNFEIISDLSKYDGYISYGDFKCKQCSKEYLNRKYKFAFLDKCECQKGMSRGETYVLNYLKKLSEIENMSFTSQYIFTEERCMDIKDLRFDFLVEYNNFKFMIEVDGDQHFMIRKSGGMFDKEYLIDRRKKDIIKMIHTSNLLIPTLRIWDYEIENLDILFRKFIDEFSTKDLSVEEPSDLVMYSNNARYEELHTDFVYQYTINEFLELLDENSRLLNYQLEFVKNYYKSINLFQNLTLLEIFKEESKYYCKFSCNKCNFEFTFYLRDCVRYEQFNCEHC